MASRLFISTIAVLLLAGCGRDTTDAEVKLVGVGYDPEEIGPSPTPYGGTVEYNHVDFAGAGLPLGLLGLLAYDTAGPEYIGFAPPYDAVSAFSYLFDRKLRISSFSSTAPNGPTAPDTCHLVVEPSGPIGSFTTVDAGDYMEFMTEDGRGIRLTRNPTDYPPDPQGMFIYYFGVESYLPENITHPVPDPADPANPLAMTDGVFRQANYPFGEEVTWRFPGGFSRFDEPVGSIPRPSSSVEPPTVTLPAEIGGVLLEWQGPRYDEQGNVITEGTDQHQCFEFYGERDTAPATASDCDSLAEWPRDPSTYDSFPGQMYTAPWDTEDGKLTVKWTPGQNDDTVNFTVRFLSTIDYDDEYLVRPVVEYGDGEKRPASVCEQDEAEWEFNWQSYGEVDEQGNPLMDGDQFKASAGLQGDPSSRMAEVVCTLADDGEYTFSADDFQAALDYVDSRERGAGGVIFMFSRSQLAEATVPAAKDQYDQRHEISPVAIQAATSRIGRFWWDTSADTAE